MPVWEEAKKTRVLKDCVCGFLWFVADKKNYREKKVDKRLFTLIRTTYWR